jgi:hypothetical protein
VRNEHASAALGCAVGGNRPRRLRREEGGAEGRAPRDDELRHDGRAVRCAHGGRHADHEDEAADTIDEKNLEAELAKLEAELD